MLPVWFVSDLWDRALKDLHRRHSPGGSDTIMCAIYLYCDFHTFLYVRKELNVIDSGTVVLVITILVKI